MRDLAGPGGRLTPVRANDNELIFFDYVARESWILYPSRSQYLAGRRLLAGQTLVERRPWNVAAVIEQHVISPGAGCASHGIDCGANRAVLATAEIHWNPFQYVHPPQDPATVAA